MSRYMRFPKILYVRPAKPQISLCIHPAWLEPLLVTWIFYECEATDWTSFGVSKLKPSSKILLLTIPRQYFFCGSFVLFMSCVCHAFPSIHCCYVVTCWAWADLLALICDVKLCFCHFPMWYPRPDVVLDCIDSWSLPPFLLSKLKVRLHSLIRVHTCQNATLLEITSRLIFECTCTTISC